MPTGPKYGIRNHLAFALAFAAPLVLALSACSVNDGPSSDDPEETENANATEAPDNAGATPVDDSANGSTPLPPPSEPIEMAKTAWAANDAEGVVYTTYVDPDGSYRDFRDGKRHQIGSWDMPGSNRICYRPDNALEGEDGRSCWTVRPPGRDGVMIAVDSDGCEVTVRRVKYVPPAKK